MDVMVRVKVPKYIYQFYENASAHVANCSAEDIMADALSAYAGLLSEDISRTRSLHSMIQEERNNTQ